MKRKLTTMKKLSKKPTSRVKIDLDNNGSVRIRSTYDKCELVMENVFITLNQSGRRLGNQVHISEEAAVRWIEDKGFSSLGIEIVEGTICYQKGKERI